MGYDVLTWVTSVISISAVLRWNRAVISIYGLQDTRGDLGRWVLPMAALGDCNEDQLLSKCEAMVLSSKS